MIKHKVFGRPHNKAIRQLFYDSSASISFNTLMAETTSKWQLFARY